MYLCTYLFNHSVICLSFVIFSLISFFFWGGGGGVQSLWTEVKIDITNIENVKYVCTRIDRFGRTKIE